jgi:hypothetical protein
MKIYRLIVVCILMVGCQNNFTRIALEKNIEKSDPLQSPPIVNRLQC